MRIFGASAGRWFGSARRIWINSCKVGPAVLAVGTGGNGRIEPSAARGASTARAGDSPSAAIAKAKNTIGRRIGMQMLPGRTSALVAAITSPAAPFARAAARCRRCRNPGR